MIRVRRSAERGRFDHGWLDTRHTFSFADYHDPRWMGFRSLRVINEDVVQPGEGFGMHPHRDMEILTWILAGGLRHGDSMGNGSVIRPGDLQRMSAGTGIVHGEWNASDREPVHLLQVWILPERKGLAPGYEQVAVPPEALRGRLRRIASRAPGEGEVAIRQDASLWAARLSKGDVAVHPLAKGRAAWVQVARGEVLVGGVPASAGDGAHTEDAGEIRIESPGESEVLLFDLA